MNIAVAGTGYVEGEKMTPEQKADVLGIYEQNGSGKMTFVHAMKLLKMILQGGVSAE